MTAPRWLAIARRYAGTREVPGKQNNPVIVGWAKKLGGFIASFYKEDSIPWCALFVNAVLQEAMLKGTASLAARSFEKWGVKLSRGAPGAILVFARQGGGHVGFYVGENATAYRVFGGNQSDNVNEIWVAKSRLVPNGIRWPDGEPLPTSGPVMLNSKGKLSTNEASMATFPGAQPEPETAFEEHIPEIDDAPPQAADETPELEKEPQSPFRYVMQGMSTIFATFGGIFAYLNGIKTEIIIVVGLMILIYMLVTHFFPRPVILQKFPEADR